MNKVSHWYGNRVTVEVTNDDDDQHFCAWAYGSETEMTTATSQQDQSIYDVILDLQFQASENVAAELS
ncbi:hypothetical protein FOXB_01089 [Fusarium oxysporum f. sp. conglutinans Fo5176]|uniref:Uncharacterized protein n=1 Tax=Fusarium oxysporum (strain Fo5176) TaxID=660025 RepID=F9F3W4_FUSOF|nr:hypothetical protein FOXB_01089 [Fusarium oxysporum f. sp. conglutinans Fo5176]